MTVISATAVREAPAEDPQEATLFAFSAPFPGLGGVAQWPWMQRARECQFETVQALSKPQQRRNRAYWDYQD